MVDMNINLSGANEPQKKNNNKVPNYLSGDNSSQQSGSIFDNNSKMPTVIGEFEKQNKKLDNASNKPAFEMTKAEKQEAQKLNKEQKQRANYQKKVKAEEERQAAIRKYDSYIKKYKIDVRGKSAEQIKQAVHDIYQKNSTIEKPKQSNEASSDKQKSAKAPKSYNYTTDPKPIKNYCGFNPERYELIEKKYEKYDISKYDMDEKDETDKNFKYTSNRSKDCLEEANKAYRKKQEFYAENEIDRRMYSYQESAIMVETYGGFREATVFGDIEGYHGKIGSNNFKMYKRENDFDPGNQYLGRIGRQDVDIEERDIHHTIIGFSSGLNRYFGKIGNNDFEMESNLKACSEAERAIYEGKYKGKSFQVEVGRDNIEKDDGDRVIRGYFDGQRVDITKYPANLTHNDRFQIKDLPKDFEDIASFIFVAHTELEKTGILKAVYESGEY